MLFTLNFWEVSIQLLPPNLIFWVPRHVIEMFRWEHVHMVSRLNVYICPIKIIISLVTVYVILFIAQRNNCSIISVFFWEWD